MVPEFGLFELMVVAIAALVVVGPKDLPKLMGGLGRIAAKARGLAAEFRAAFDEMAREAELEDLKSEVDQMKRANPLSQAKRELEDAMRPLNAPVEPARKGDDGRRSDIPPMTRVEKTSEGGE